jgi:hypothetical protein
VYGPHKKGNGITYELEIGVYICSLDLCRAKLGLKIGRDQSFTIGEQFVIYHCINIARACKLGGSRVDVNSGSMQNSADVWAHNLNTEVV